MTEESALHNLVACYFHEDWDIEGPTVEGVIDTYLRDVTPDEVREALSEIAVQSRSRRKMSLIRATSEHA